MKCVYNNAGPLTVQAQSPEYSSPLPRPLEYKISAVALKQKSKSKYQRGVHLTTRISCAWGETVKMTAMNAKYNEPSAIAREEYSFLECITEADLTNEMLNTAKRRSVREVTSWCKPKVAHD